MSELGDDFDEKKKASQEKRATNRKSSLAIIRREGLPVDVKNAGAHLIVRNSWGYVFDFWPGTGKFIEAIRSKGFKDTGHRRTGRGVQKLIAMMKGGRS